MLGWAAAALFAGLWVGERGRRQDWQQRRWTAPLLRPGREPKLQADVDPDGATQGLITDDKRETMIRDAMREGLNRMEAEKDVDNLLAAFLRDQPPG